MKGFIALPSEPNHTFVGAGLPAMQATRYISDTALMLSQASQLPQKPGIASYLETVAHQALITTG
ncbi:hypothetical protein EJ576_07250 [Pseudomonas sp. C 49-2]|nr:hypothetical protein EJ576_07250 [Pseudomonas sp. C 49-2]